ncbi:MAG: hypothetical protein ACRC5T_11030 [Cetobacterium sp.]
MENKCAKVFLILLMLISSHAFFFYLGTKNTLTFKIESRQGEVAINEIPMKLKQTKEISDVDVKLLDEVYNEIQGTNDSN